MANDWQLVFGDPGANPAATTGLSPTFILFSLGGLTAAAAPGITETPVGSGIYQFSYTPTLSISFVADGGAALTNGRYIPGGLNPSMVVSNEVGALSNGFGSTSVDPTTLIGWAKRAQEFNEGNATFDKSSGDWSIYSRGSSTLLAEKTLTNTTSQATKT